MKRKQLTKDVSAFAHMPGGHGERTGINMTEKTHKAPMVIAIVLLICAVGASYVTLMNEKGQNPDGTPVNGTNISTKGDGKTKKAPGGGTYVQHEGEMMAVWVPYMSLSVEDNPSQEAFEKKFDEIVETSKQHNMNTLIVHVHPFGDALYPSKYYPWSHILTGTQGKDPGYDPLKYMVEASHKAGLEFHAWINPLRIKVSDTPKALSSDNAYNKWKNDKDKSNDDYVLDWDGDLYFNPAYPEVRKYIIDSVAEIVENYAVDGIHFDDYFYPTSDVEYDKDSYNAYTKSLGEDSTPLTQNAWRTANINALVSGVYSTVHSKSGHTVFGISPQGNIENDIGMGADVYSWGKTDGFVDYICPQIYVSFDHPLLPFDGTADEWRQLVKNKNVSLYIGLAVYKAGSDADEGSWEGSKDILKKEIEYGRELKADGFMLYSYDYLVHDQTKDEIENVMKVIS